MKYSINEIQDSGQLIILSNGTKYKVSSFDAYHTRIWMKFDEVSVDAFKMTNHSRGNQSVDVTQAR